MTSRLSIAPSCDWDDPATKAHLIYFITGNPGLISYYNEFLGTLHQLLSDDRRVSTTDKFFVYGESLAGFGEDDSPSTVTGYPYTLEDQIETRVRSLKDQKIPSGPRQGESYDSVILIGHSVGSYILLEVLCRIQDRSLPLRIKGGILLMPTVMGLAESASGVKAVPLVRIPGFARVASIVAQTLLWPVPRSTVRWLVGGFMGMPQEGAEVTTSFLKSSMGIWQAL